MNCEPNRDQDRHNVALSHLALKWYYPLRSHSLILPGVLYPVHVYVLLSSDTFVSSKVADEVLLYPVVGVPGKAALWAPLAAFQGSLHRSGSNRRFRGVVKCMLSSSLSGKNPGECDRVEQR